MDPYPNLLLQLYLGHAVLPFRTWIVFGLSVPHVRQLHFTPRTFPIDTSHSATFQGGFIPDAILYTSYWYTGPAVRDLVRALRTNQHSRYESC